jgi:hypothetical protein
MVSIMAADAPANSVNRFQRRLSIDDAASPISVREAELEMGDGDFEPANHAQRFRPFDHDQIAEQFAKERAARQTLEDRCRELLKLIAYQFVDLIKCRANEGRHLVIEPLLVRGPIDCRRGIAFRIRLRLLRVRLRGLGPLRLPTPESIRIEIGIAAACGPLFARIFPSQLEYNSLVGRFVEIISHVVSLPAGTVGRIGRGSYVLPTDPGVCGTLVPGAGAGNGPG